jgi:putative flavoprotein involved in K+ transport
MGQYDMPIEDHAEAGAARRRGQPLRLRRAWSWIDVPFLDETGCPDHHRGVVRPAPGLYVPGLPWLHTWGSGRFASVARDAGHLAAEMAPATAR